MDKRVKVFVVDIQAKFIDMLSDYLLEYPELNLDMVGKAVTKDEFMEQRNNFGEVDVFILPSSLPDGTGMELFDFLDGNRVLAEKPVIFTVDKQTRSQIAVAERAGVDYIFQKPFSAGEFCKRILYHGLLYKGVIEGVSFERFSEDPFSYIDSGPGSESSRGLTNIKKMEEVKYKEAKELVNFLEEDEEGELAKKKIKGGIISFFSSKSTGKTSIISNIAQALVRHRTRPSVCILDFNFQYPTMTQLFMQDELSYPNRDIYDVFMDTAYMDEDLIKEALIVHNPTGITFLHTPNDLDSLTKINLITNDQVEKVLLQVREMFDFVLVDTHNDIFSTVNLTLLEYSQKNYIFLEPDYTTVIGGNKILQVIKYLEDDKRQKIIDDTHLVLNKDTGRLKDSLNDDTVFKYMFGKRFVSRIPYDPNFNTYINRAEFAILSNSPVRGPIMELVEHIFPELETRDKPSGRLNLGNLRSLFKR